MKVKAVALACAMSFSALMAGSAEASVAPYGSGGSGTFLNVLPPGENGFANVAALGRYEANGALPAHTNDQLAMYHDLTTAAPGITRATLGRYFKDATFGVKPDDVASSESPEAGVTIIRDKGFGIPHIYGDTRDALEFGIGWATAEDRLFEVDVLRHAGAGTLAGFAGGANVSQDRSSWANEPYTQDDLMKQAAYIRSLPGGSQVVNDAINYVAGLNAYITMAEANPINQALYLPGEYAAIGQPGGPQPFQVTDIISTASLIGGQLGQGGGAALRRALLYEDLRKRFGAEHLNVAGAPGVVRLAHRPRRDLSGYGTFSSLLAPDDPEAPSTVMSKHFPYQTLPAPNRIARGSVALPDPGSVQYVKTLVSSGAADVRSTAAPVVLDPAAARARAEVGVVQSGLRNGFPHSDSNALLVSARHSANGHPIAVIGPQVAYWSPEVLMEEDIHGPGIDATGASFPGTNVYVELGHGRNYAWSATSEGQNIIDTFAVPLCVPGGGTVPADSDYYVLGHSCVKMETLRESESWSPSLADSTAAGSATFETKRTAYGLVIARARIGGKPVVYTNLRSTYLHELDSAIGFEAFNDPAQMGTPSRFQHDAYRIGYTFNWFFINPNHIAYMASGANPVRAPGTDPAFPSFSRFIWRGYKPSAQLSPAGTTERQTPFAQHPQTVDQAYLTSWNNKPAHSYDYVNGEVYSSIYRSQLLDLGIKHYLRTGHGRMSAIDLVNAMGNAGTQDLRGVEVLPYALRLLGSVKDATLGPVVGKLRAWVASGSHRINRASPGASGTYEQGDAVRIIDAWWPLLIKAEWGPVLGTALLNEMESNFNPNDAPHGHLGSAWDTGFYGLVQKDLRAAAGLRVGLPLNRVYCGSGSRRACRSALLASLRQAAAMSPAEVYPASSGCAAGDEMCFDAIHYTSIGLFKEPNQEWVNRPTFQQVISYP